MSRRPGTQGMPAIKPRLAGPRSEKPTETGLGPPSSGEERTLAKTQPGGFVGSDAVPPSSMPTVVRRVVHADTIKDINVEVKRCPECGARFGIDATFCPFDGVGLTATAWDPTGDPLAGKVVDHRYEVVGPLGEGGMGTVYRVRHVTLDRHFAMKVLRRDLASDAELAQRFVQEARATAAIKHPSVVAINDFGELDDGIPYFVMEILDGETLATRLRARGPLAPRIAIGVAKKVAEALAASHLAQVIHRDLKPENVFLVGTCAGKAPEDEIRIVDFGAAKVIGGSKLTRPGIVFGTPYYMSPEQASGQPIDPRADVYSLGVLLYEMITGNVPFEADTYMGVLTKHMFADPIKPSERAPAGIQLGALEDIILRALAKDPNDRFSSMTAFAKALDEAERKRSSDPPRPQSPSRLTLPLGSMSAADRIQVSIRRREQQEARRKQRLIGIVITAAVATLVLGAGLLAMTSSSPPSANATPPNATTPARPPATSAVNAHVDVPPPPAPDPTPTTALTDENATSSTVTPTVPRKPPASFSPRPRPAAPPATTPAPKPTPTVTAPATASPPPRRPEEFPDPWADPPKR